MRPFALIFLIFAVLFVAQPVHVFAATVSMNSAPRCVSRGVNLIDCVVLGQDDAVWHTAYNGTWSNWRSLGGSFDSAPAIVSWNADRLDVFVRGTNNQFYHKPWHVTRHNGMVWGGWDKVLGQLPNAVPVGDLSCFSRGFLKVDCFVFDQSGNIWRNSFDPNIFWGTHWSNWQMVRASPDPGTGLGSYGWNVPEFIGIVTVTSNGTLVQGALQGYSTISWTRLPSIAGVNESDPACVSSQSGSAYCGVATSDGKIWLTQFYSASWHQWAVLPGKEALSSGPSITTNGQNLDVFARGSDNGLWVNTFDDGAWSGWSSVPMTPIS